MKGLGISANIVALSGIAIAIGTMVDMGIIITERIQRTLNENPDNSLIDNVKTGYSEVYKPVLTAGLTTIVSFLPIFTLTGAEGKMFLPLAITKSLSLIIALFLALIFLPLFFISSKKSHNEFIKTIGLYLCNQNIRFSIKSFMKVITSMHMNHNFCFTEYFSR